MKINVASTIRLGRNTNYILFYILYIDIFFFFTFTKCVYLNVSVLINLPTNHVSLIIYHKSLICICHITFFFFFKMLEKYLISNSFFQQILGFANFLLWLCSLWFIYKETIFFTQPEAAPDMNQSQQTKGVGKV